MNQYVKATGTFYLLILFLFTNCKKEVKPLTLPAENTPPIAHAGADQVLILPANSVILDGSKSIDRNNNIKAYLWTKLEGPATFTLSNSTTVQAQLKDLVEGVYQFELKATNAGGSSAKDTVEVKVLSVPVSNYPLRIISGAATLARIGSLTEAKYVEPATAGDKIVFASGYIDKGIFGMSHVPTNTVDIYQPKTNTWSAAILSEDHGYGGAVAAAGNKILYAGGTSRSGHSTSRVDIYDAVTNQWSTAELSRARSSMATAVAGSKAFFAGGWTNSVYSDRVDIYDAAMNAWATASLSQARIGFSAIAAGGKVFFAGGYKGFNQNDQPDDFSTRVDIYDIATNRWSIAELSETRYGITVAAIGDKVFFAGGATSIDPYVSSNRVDVYDMATKTWSTTRLTEARSGIRAVTAGNKIVFAGGQSRGTSASVDIYDASSNSWSTAQLSQPRIVASSATLGTKALFFSGSGSSYNHIDIYDASTNNWSVIVFDKWILSFLVAAGNDVFIGGGKVGTLGADTDFHVISDVWKLQF